MSDVAYEQLKIIGIIVDNSKGTRMVKYLNKQGYRHHFAMIGKGTAPSAIATYLGLSESDKAVIFAVCKESQESSLMDLLHEKFSEEGKSNGIAFSIGMQTIAGKMVLDYLSAEEEK